MERTIERRENSEKMVNRKGPKEARKRKKRGNRGTEEQREPRAEGTRVLLKCLSQGPFSKAVSGYRLI